MSLLGLHFARSFATVAFYEQRRELKGQQVADNMRAQYSDPQIVRALTGLEAPPASAPSLAQDLLAQAFESRIEENALPATLLLENYERGRAIASAHQLGFWYTTDELSRLAWDIGALGRRRDRRPGTSTRPATLTRAASNPPLIPQRRRDLGPIPIRLEIQLDHHTQELLGILPWRNHLVPPPPEPRP